MTEGLLTGSVVTITWTDDSVGVVVIAASPEDTKARLNTVLNQEVLPAYLTFESIDTDKVLWFNRELIAAIEVEPLTLADASTVVKEPSSA